MNKTTRKIKKIQWSEITRLMQNIRRAFTYGWQFDRRNFVSYMISATIQIAASLLSAYFGARLLNALVNYLGSTQTDTNQIFLFFGLSASLITIEQLAWRYMGYIQNSSYISWHTTLAPIFNGKFANLDIQRFEDGEFNKLINKVVQDYSWKPANFIYNSYSTMHGIARTISTAIIIAGFVPLLIPLLLLAIVPSLFVEKKHNDVKWDIWSLKGDTSRRYHKITWMMQNKVDVMDMRLFGLNSYLIDYCRKLLDEFNTEQQRALKHFIRPALAVRILEGVLVAGIELWLILRVLARSGFGIGQYSFYSGMVRQFNNSVGLVLTSLATVMEYNLYMSDFFEFMDTPQLLPTAGKTVTLAKHTIPEIRFENVSFHYPTSKRHVFKNLNLTISPGERVALVGENGVGKSTLLKLLMRFYDVTDGRILIDGYDIRDLDINSWYRLIGVLFQDISRYPFSIEDNIRIGRVHHSKNQKQIQQAAHLAGLESVIAELPHGYKTVLDNSFDEGVEPSGGQWQRVGLAKAFYRDAPILILDEPTAAIDAKAEYDIFNNIFAQHQGKTAIIVSHRFSTVRKADRILVFDNGAIVGSGSHESLMQQKGLYHEMFTKQAEGYK